MTGLAQLAAVCAAGCFTRTTIVRFPRASGKHGWKPLTSQSIIMNPTWQNHLVSSGALIVDGRVEHFGNPAKEKESARGGTIVTDLSALGVIAFSGEDSQSFLQGQITSDVRQAGPGKSQYGGYCTPKGRLLASFLLWQTETGYCVQLPAVLLPTVQKRLTMYVLRSKVKVLDASEQSVRLGLAGAAAAQVVQRLYGEAPAAPHDVLRANGDTVIRLPGERFEIVTAPDNAPALWDRLAQDCIPVGSSWWEWLELRAGIASILPATQEQFVPQMVNCEAIGGVSFQKGCYPGQEIVARTQYLGKLKRRMYLANIDGTSSAAPGDELFSPDLEGQASGMIVNAHPSPDGGCDVLAVIQISSAETGNVHWKTADGPALRFLPLPYPL